LISALMLFSGKLFARIIAIPWLAAFSAYLIWTTLVGRAQNQTDRIVQRWGFCNLLAIAYLIGSGFIQRRSRRAAVRPA
jgi:hypothetical protein